MRRIIIAAAILFYGLTFAPVSFCDEAPQVVTPCQLKNDPLAYNHKLVEVTGVVARAFEAFAFVDPCSESLGGVWLEYGGKSGSGTIYCCGKDDRHGSNLVVENIPIPLVKDEQFRKFDRLMHSPEGGVAYASVTIVGRFFAGEQQHLPGGTFWGGYGHFGMYSLLAIQQITSVTAMDRRHLDYLPLPDEMSITKKGCTSRFLTPPSQPETDLVDQQKQADSNQRDWAFNDPRRVAFDELTRVAHIASIAEIRQKKTSRGRVVYQWRDRSAESYTVIVSQPFWLSAYAEDHRRVAWVVVASYVSSCP